MANEQHQIGLPAGTQVISNRGKISGSTIASGDGMDATTFAALASFNTLRAALTAANGTYFTAARLNTMNKNDMVHCWLIIQGFKAG